VLSLFPFFPQGAQFPFPQCASQLPKLNFIEVVKSFERSRIFVNRYQTFAGISLSFIPGTPFPPVYLFPIRNGSFSRITHSHFLLPPRIQSAPFLRLPSREHSHSQKPVCDQFSPACVLSFSFTWTDGKLVSPSFFSPPQIVPRFFPNSTQNSNKVLHCLSSLPVAHVPLLWNELTPPLS